MTDIFRTLCAELLDVIDSLPHETNYKNESRCVFPIDEDVVSRARLALNQLEPEGPKIPTDNEIIGCMYKGHTNISKLEPTWINRHGKELIAGVRCVLDMCSRSL